MPSETLAIAFLLLVGLVPGVLLAKSIIRPNFTIAQACLLSGAVVLTRILWRSGRSPRLHVDAGAIIVCNHRSSVDPFFVQVCSDRPIRWMVAREYCEHPLFRWFLTTCDVIPVNRAGIDTAATKTAIRCVQEGGLVGMFPEGRINTTAQFMLPVRPGATLVASKTGVPLIPCHISGSPYGGTPWSPFLMSAKVRVRFGRAVQPTLPGEVVSDQQALMLSVVAQLAELAGQSDFEPRLAGRRWRPELGGQSG